MTPSLPETSPPALSPEPFDEIGWLADFASVGGTCWLSDQGSLASGWEIAGRTCAEQLEARRLIGEIFDHPQAFMRKRQLVDLLTWTRGLHAPAHPR